MIARKINRRAALIGLTSALAGVSLGHYILSPAPSNPQTQQANPQYVQPTWWDGENPYTKKFMLAMDFAFWQIENQAPPPTSPPPSTIPFNAAASLVLTTMTQPGQAEFKLTQATFLADSQRWQYLPYLVHALDPAVSPDRSTRLGIVGAFHKFFHDFGNAPFSVGVEQDLLSRYTTENDQVVKNRIDRLLTLLNVPH